VVQRQKERDMAFLLRLVEGLARPQVATLSHVQQALLRYRPTAIPAVLDTDVRDAAAAMAATLETAARGIVYEHQTASLPAQRLVGLFREVMSRFDPEGRLPPAAVAAVFRRLEWGVREASAIVGAADTAFLEFTERVLLGSAERDSAAQAAQPDEQPERRHAPRIIVP